MEIYGQYRAAHERLSQAVADTLTADEVEDAADALGVPVAPPGAAAQRALADHALHRWPNAVTPSAVERYRKGLTAAPSPTEALVLQSMLRAPYRLLHVTRVDAAAGVLVMRDALRSESLEVRDAKLSASVQAGVTFGGRVLILPELCMSTAALLAADPRGLAALEAALEAGRLPATAAAARGMSAFEAERVGATIARCLLGTTARRRPRRRKKGRRPR